MQNMMSMYGNMCMDPMDMDQEMLAAYRYSRPNWNMNRYICTACGRTYSLQASLYNHKKFECGKSPNFICPYCPHRTKQKGNLKTHIKKRHPEFFTEPFMPSPTRLNSMMNSIMMQSSIMQQSIMPNSQGTASVQNHAATTPDSPAATLHNSYRSLLNPSSGNVSQSSTKSPIQPVSSLLEAIKHGLTQNASSQSAISAANVVQALSQNLPNSSNISPLDIMQLLAQGTSKNPLFPNKIASSDTLTAGSSPVQSSISISKIPLMNQNSLETPLTVLPAVNGGGQSEQPKDPLEIVSTVSHSPKSPNSLNLPTISLHNDDSEDSSDTPILPSYPVQQ